MTHSLKAAIQANFDQSASSYDAYCTPQKRVCDQLITLLTKHARCFNTVADFGCGSGESTRRLIQSIAFEHCYGVDFANLLMRKAKAKLGSELNISWVQGDFECPLFSASTFNLVFSNMGFQWAMDQPATFAMMRHYLVKDGVLAFSIPVHDNFPELNAAYKLTTPDHHDVLSLLARQGFKVVESSRLTLIEPFPSQLEALKSLKRVGANTNTRQLNHGPVRLTQVFKSSNCHQLTYEIGLYIASKR